MPGWQQLVNAGKLAQPEHRRCLDYDAACEVEDM
jgi:hypothetical protein